MDKKDFPLNESYEIDIGHGENNVSNNKGNVADLSYEKTMSVIENLRRKYSDDSGKVRVLRPEEAEEISEILFNIPDSPDLVFLVDSLCKDGESGNKNSIFITNHIIDLLEKYPERFGNIESILSHLIYIQSADLENRKYKDRLISPNKDYINTEKTIIDEYFVRLGNIANNTKNDRLFRFVNHINEVNYSVQTQYFSKSMWNDYVSDSERVLALDSFFRPFGELDFHYNWHHIKDVLGEEVLRQVVEKCSGIIGAVQDISDYLRKNFLNGAMPDKETIDEIAYRLIDRAWDLLSDALTSAEKTKKSYQNSYRDDFLKRLENVKTETMLFLSAFKTLKRGGLDVDLTAIKDVQFYSTSGKDLSPDDIERMKEMYAKNYAYSPEIRDDLIAGFENAAKSENTEFYLVRYKGEIISFIRFDDEGGGRLHAGSLNVKPEFRGSAIGEVVMEKTLDMKAKESILEADCAALLDVGAHYIEIGFVANKYYQYKGEPSFIIERNDRIMYRSRLMSKEEIASEFESDKYKEGDVIISASDKKDPEQLKFELLNKGYVLVRYFNYNNKWYCVFERRFSDEFQEPVKKAA
jgi:GNAT superfamily N-acetyltransferase